MKTSLKISEAACQVITNDQTPNEEMSENIIADHHDDALELTSPSETVSFYRNEASLEKLKMDLEVSPQDDEVNFDTELQFTDKDFDFSYGSSSKGCYLSSGIAMKTQSHRKTKVKKLVPEKTGNTDKNEKNFEKEKFSGYTVNNEEAEEARSDIHDVEHEQGNQEDLSDLLIKKLHGIGKISSEKQSLNDAPLDENDICSGEPSTPLQSITPLQRTQSPYKQNEPMETPKQFVPILKVEEMECNGHQKTKSKNTDNGELKISNSQNGGLRVPPCIRPSSLGSKTQKGKRQVKSAPQKETVHNESQRKVEKQIEKNTDYKEMQDTNAVEAQNILTTERQREKESVNIHSKIKKLGVKKLEAGEIEKTEGNDTNGNTTSDRKESTETSANPGLLPNGLKIITEKDNSSACEENVEGKMDSIVEMAYYNDDYFKKFERQNLSEQRELKKHFRSKIAEAKKTLRQARKKAQEQTVARRFDEAVRKQKEMQQRRISTRSSSTISTASSVKPRVKPTDNKTKFLNTSEKFKKERLEVREIRQAEAQLDRAKVAKKSKERLIRNSTVDLVSRPTSIKAKMRRDRERMERYEVEYLISELRYLNMEDYATKLIEALEFKEELEMTLRSQLAQKRKFAIEMAKRRKLEEQKIIREEEKRRRREEKERRERERKEREEIEREIRRKEALKRREQNLKLWELYNFTVLATDTSRSFTYSYLPALKTPPPVKEEKTKKIELKNVRSRYMMQ